MLMSVQDQDITPKRPVILRVLDTLGVHVVANKRRFEARKMLRLSDAELADLGVNREDLEAIVQGRVR